MYVSYLTYAKKTNLMGIELNLLHFLLKHLRNTNHKYVKIFKNFRFENL